MKNFQGVFNQEFINPMLNLVKFDRNDILDLIGLSESVGWDYDINEIKTAQVR